jgi:hypothetical protein
VMNIGTASATITMTVGTAVVVHPNVGGSTTFLPAEFAVIANCYSAIVDADQSIAAVVTLTNRESGPYGTPGGVAGAQYQATDDDATATTVMFPIAKRAYGASPNTKTTLFFVQNAGSAVTTVTATYSGCSNGGGPYTNTSTSVNPNEMVIMNPAAAGVPSGTLCSAKMTGSQPLAAMMVEQYSAETTGTLAQATRGYTSADYDTTLYAPIFKQRFPNHPTLSRTTGVQVQNVEPVNNVDITATYYGNCTGLPWSETRTGIAPGASANFLYPSGLPVGCLASATITSTGQIVGIANESYLNPPPGPGTQSSASYNLFRTVLTNTRILVPQYKEQFGGKTSGLQVMNVGTSNATIHAVFNSGANTYTTINYIVPPGASQTFYLMANCNCWVGAPMPAGTNASVMMFSDQPLVGLIAEMPYTAANPSCFGQANGPCYDRMIYEAFNVSP